jgi:hypothetical protein
LSDFYIKRGDRGPSLQATLVDHSGNAINLTSASAVKFKMAQIVDAAAVVVSASAGTVRYDWALDDTRVAGTYNAEFEIEWSDGRKQTVPNDGYLTVEVGRDLG